MDDDDNDELWGNDQSVNGKKGGANKGRAMNSDDEPEMAIEGKC